LWKRIAVVTPPGEGRSRRIRVVDRTRLHRLRRPLPGISSRGFSSTRQICPYPVDLRCGEEARRETRRGTDLEAVGDAQVEPVGPVDLAVVDATLSEEQLSVDDDVSSELELCLDHTAADVVLHLVRQFEVLLVQAQPHSETEHIIEQMRPDRRRSEPRHTIGVVAVGPATEPARESSTEPLLEADLERTGNTGAEHEPLGPHGDPETHLAAEGGVAPPFGLVLLTVLDVVDLEHAVLVRARLLVHGPLRGRDLELPLERVCRRDAVEQVEDEDEDERELDELHGALL